MKKKRLTTDKMGEIAGEINYSEEQVDEVSHAIKTMVRILMAVDEDSQAKIAEEERKRIDAEKLKNKNY